MSVSYEARALAEELIALRREIHAEPELGRQLTLTRQKGRWTPWTAGAYLVLGACPPAPDLGDCAYNHAPRAVFDDSVVPSPTVPRCSRS
ncbi:hypothetical protein [Streptomyces beihaiensis]|uniref:Hippurate hydrolase n=1 Tax=Streptomyces beihaiensis TaxID=2984495 RepID=A0ABT3U3A1_9ACTN|nr:hypothetical protein [Streptomyces beihaiensis]MCX3063166.1 hypothetical protein [Streptomyces beihaiensis]